MVRCVFQSLRVMLMATVAGVFVPPCGLAQTADAPAGDGAAKQGDNTGLKAKSQPAAYDPLYTVQALNMAIVSVSTIIDTENRVVLDSEYRRIINNLKLGSIADDDELIDAYREVMDFITKKTLRTDEAERFRTKMEKAKSRSFLRAATGIRAYGADPLSFALSLVTSVASAGFNYYEQKETFAEEFSDQEWQIKKEDIEDLNNIHKQFIQSAWKLLRKYGVKDELRLTEDTIKLYLDTMKEQDDEKALRMFDNIKRHFEAYPPFYYYYASRAIKAKRDDLARQCYKDFERLWKDVLRPDPLMASVAVSMLSDISLQKEPEKAERYIGLAENNLRDNDDGMLRFGIAEAKKAFGKAEDAKKLLQHNIDFNTCATESKLALDNLNAGRPILEGSEDALPLVSGSQDASSVKGERGSVEILQKKAEQGDAEAQWQLGDCFRLGTGIEKDDKQAVKWYRKAAEQSNAEGQWNIGCCYLYGVGVVTDEKQAVEWLRKAAEQNNAEGQYHLGCCYSYGAGVEKDDKQAVSWYRKAAEQNNAAGQWNIGDCYQYGWGIEKDEKQAAEWFRKAAEQNNAEGQYRLGRCYSYGSGVEKDDKQALIWFRKSAEKNCAEGQRWLGCCYLAGAGVEKDEKQAVIWFRKSAEQNCAAGQARLGYCYFNGQGVEKDEKQAAEWYRKAAEQNDAVGQWNLGWCCENGLGVEKDAKQAIELYRKAAEQNDANACFMLGKCFWEGVLAEKNSAEALKWFSKAAELGSEKAKEFLASMGK